MHGAVRQEFRSLGKLSQGTNEGVLVQQEGRWGTDQRQARCLRYEAGS